MFVGGAGVAKFGPLPHQRHPAVHGDRLVAGIQHRDTRTRGAHHGRKYEQGVAEQPHWMSGRVEVARVIGVHEAIAAVDA